VRPGHKGPDTFVFDVTGRIYLGEGTATVRVSVTVEWGRVPTALPLRRQALAKTFRPHNRKGKATIR